MEKFERTAAEVLDGRNRLHLAINALAAIRDLCMEGACGQPKATLDHVGADNLTCLLGLVIDEMRDAEEAIGE